MSAALLAIVLLAAPNATRCQVAAVTEMFDLAARDCGTLKVASRLFEDGAELDAVLFGNRVDELCGKRVPETEVNRLYREAGERAESEILRHLRDTWPHFGAAVSRQQILGPEVALGDPGIVEYAVHTVSGVVRVGFALGQCRILSVTVEVPALQRRAGPNSPESSSSVAQCANPPVRRDWREIERRLKKCVRSSNGSHR